MRRENKSERQAMCARGEGDCSRREEEMKSYGRGRWRRTGRWRGFRVEMGKRGRRRRQINGR